LIVGFDHDDADIFQEQVQFINDARIPFALPSILSALPGTPLYKRMEDAGRLIPDDEARLTAYMMNITPTAMTLDELEQGYRGMVVSLYEPGTFARRILGELDRLSSATGPVSNYSWPFLIAAMGWVLLWYVCDPNRGKLLRAFFKIAPATLWRHPRLADVALQRLVTYRHVARFVSILERRRAYSTTDRMPDVGVVATQA
jgi:hypothetical protein